MTKQVMHQLVTSESWYRTLLLLAKKTNLELADGSLLTDPSTGANASAPDAGDDVAVFTNTCQITVKTRR